MPRKRGFTLATSSRPLTLKDLRVWHWKQSQVARKRQYKNEIEATVRRAHNLGGRLADERANAAKRIADFHIKAVQALNEVVPGTAERDLQEMNDVAASE